MANMSDHILPPFHYRLGTLAGLEPGVLPLEAPVADDGAVLLNSVVVKGETPMAELAVTVDHPQITIANRAGDRPLQIYDMQGERKSSVLLHPVPALVLHGQGHDVYMLDVHNVRVGDRLAMAHFLQTISTFSGRAEQKLKARHASEAALKLLDTFEE